MKFLNRGKNKLHTRKVNKRVIIGGSLLIIAVFSIVFFLTDFGTVNVNASYDPIKVGKASELTINQGKLISIRTASNVPITITDNSVDDGTSVYWADKIKIAKLSDDTVSNNLLSPVKETYYELISGDDSFSVAEYLDYMITENLATTVITSSYKKYTESSYLDLFKDSEESETYQYLFVVTISFDNSRSFGMYRLDRNISRSDGATTTVHISPTAQDQATDDAVDIGDKIELSASGSNLIFYSTNETIIPVLTRILESETTLLADLKSQEANTQLSNVSFYGEDGDDANSVGDIVVIKSAAGNELNYLKINNLWYSFSKSLTVIDVENTSAADYILVDSTISKNVRLAINALTVRQGFDIGEYTYTQFPHILRNTVIAPNAISVNNDLLDENALTAKLGDTIYLKKNTTEAEYFYTTNGTTPVVKLDANNQLQPDNSFTKKYTEEGIYLNNKVASFGELLYVRVIGYFYLNGYRIMKDSPEKTLQYEIANSLEIPSLSTSLTTVNSSPTTVRVGKSIQLFVGPCVSENGVVTPVEPQDPYKIYYTIDGTEPTFDANGNPNAGTLEYVNNIVVPKPEDSLFTITAIATDGKWSYSNIGRFIYAYPDVVSAPFATPIQGYVAENTAVTLKSSTEGVIIYYNISNGTTPPEDPTTDSNIFTSDAPIMITEDCVIKAMATKDNIDSKVATFTYTVSDKLATPTPSIEGGSVVPQGTTIVFSALEGATVHYTVDGSNPMDTANTKVAIGNNVLLDGKVGTTITIRVYASKTDYSDSAIGIYSYTISSYEGGIYSDKEDGSVLKNGEIVTLNTDVSNAIIYYTTDGSTPTLSSKIGSKVTISGDPGSKVILKAIATTSGSTRTTMAATFTYEIMGKLKAPKSNIPSGAQFTAESQIVLTAEAGKIYYTTNGDLPTSGSTLYKEPIPITKAMTIKAIAVAEDSDNSEVSTFAYTFAEKVEDPVASEENGELEIGKEVSFSCSTPGAIMYYTTNGTDPNLDEKDKLSIYTGPIPINRATTIKIVATKENMKSSKTVTAGYTVKEQIVVQTEDDNSEKYIEENGDRLVSRRTFLSADVGPSHTDFIIKNSTYGAIISADAGVIPDGVELSIEKVQVSDTARNMVKQMVGESYDVISSYDVNLILNGEKVQPNGEVEIGIPIANEYKNAIIEIVYVADDGMVEVYETRRSNGVAYADISHLSVYSIIAPVDFEKEEKDSNLRIILIGVALTIGLIGLILIVRGRRKVKNSYL